MAPPAPHDGPAGSMAAASLLLGLIALGASLAIPLGEITGHLVWLLAPLGMIFGVYAVIQAVHSFWLTHGGGDRTGQNTDVAVAVGAGSGFLAAIVTLVNVVIILV